MKVPRRLKTFILLVILYFSAVLTVHKCQAQEAYARIVTDVTVYLGINQRIDTVIMEFIYYQDSILVVMRTSKRGGYSKWLYTNQNNGSDNTTLPTDFYTKNGTPVKIMEHNNYPGWLTVGAIHSTSLNRMIYKVAPTKLMSGDIMPQVIRYEHEYNDGK